MTIAQHSVPWEPGVAIDTASVDRLAVLKRELRRYLSILKQDRETEMIILFGTLATGVVREWSDIDLVVVMETDLPYFERIKHIRGILQPRVGLDVMVYTPEEFGSLCAKRPFFRDEILGKGKILYERARESMDGAGAAGFVDGGVGS